MLETVPKQSERSQVVAMEPKSNLARWFGWMATGKILVPKESKNPKTILISPENAFVICSPPQIGGFLWRLSFITVQVFLERCKVFPTEKSGRGWVIPGSVALHPRKSVSSIQGLFRNPPVNPPFTKNESTWCRWFSPGSSWWFSPYSPKLFRCILSEKTWKDWKPSCFLKLCILQ